MNRIGRYFSPPLHSMPDNLEDVKIIFLSRGYIIKASWTVGTTYNLISWNIITGRVVNWRSITI